MSHDVKWIRINVDIFSNRKIKQIRRLPEGDSITLIWLQLLCLAGRVNSSGEIYFAEGVPYTLGMLAVEMDSTEDMVTKAIEVFERFGMIELTDGIISICNWSKYQFADELERLKLKNAENQSRHYYRSKLRAAGFKVDSSDFTTDVEELKEIYNEYKVSLTSESGKAHEAKEDTKEDREKDIPYKEVIDYLNERTGSSFRHTAKATQRLIGARFKEGFTLEDFKTVIEVKTAEWRDDKKMSAYLRPATLFGTKFESYLNQGSRTVGKGRDDDYSAYR